MNKRDVYQKVEKCPAIRVFGKRKFLTSENSHSQRLEHKRLARSRHKESYGRTYQSSPTVDQVARETNAYDTVPTRMYAIKAPAGPAVARTKPEFKKRPVPNVPAMAILHQE